MFDLLVFLLVFFMTLMANFTARSIEFNLVISGLFLLKSIMGARMRHLNSFLVLRKFMAVRLLLDGLLILPVIGYYRYWSVTYTYNYLIVVIVIMITELVLVLNHLPHLYKRSIIECMEQLQPSQKIDFISHFNSKSKSVVGYVNTFKATKYLTQQLGYKFQPDQVPQYSYFKP